MLKSRGTCPKCASKKVIKRVTIHNSDKPDYICIQCKHIGDHPQFNSALTQQDNMERIAPKSYFS